jgi:hypothetical protein
VITAVQALRGTQRDLCGQGSQREGRQLPKDWQGLARGQGVSSLWDSLAHVFREVAKQGPGGLKGLL